VGNQSSEGNYIGPTDCLASEERPGGNNSAESPLHCQHSEGFGAPYVCVPMVALNDTIGMLHLRQERTDRPINDTDLTSA